MTLQFTVVACMFVLFELIIVFAVEVNEERQSLQWHWLSVYFLILCGLTPITLDAKQFFKGGISDDAVDAQSSLLVGSSAFISWIFAKSITNSAKSAGKYGIGGGFAYAGWYLAFPAAAVVCYNLRKKGYKSLPEAIHDKYGTASTLVFAACLLYRLYNEVWSNSRVIADFYGRQTRNIVSEDGKTETVGASDAWWAAAILSTALPLAYTFAGGMRSSLISDSGQAVLAVILLTAVLASIQSERMSNDNLKNWARAYSQWSVFKYQPNPEVSMLSLKGGMDMLALGAVQSALSYPFFDPVLTDRCFLAAPKTMARAFTVGGFCAAWFIVMFGVIGVHGSMLGKCVSDGACDESDLRGAELSDVTSGAPWAVSQTMGTAIYSLVNIIMVTSGISTLDSTFTSCAKLCGPDIHGYLDCGKPMRLADATVKHVWIGRAGMALIAVVGTLPLLDNPAELDATTIAGTVVMGLGAPIYMLAFLPEQLMWRGKRPLAFLVPVLVCAAIGITYQLGTTKDRTKQLMYKSVAHSVDFSYLAIGEGSYKTILGVNILGACLSLGLWAAFIWEWCWFAQEPDGVQERDPSTLAPFNADFEKLNLDQPTATDTANTAGVVQDDDVTLAHVA